MLNNVGLPGFIFIGVIIFIIWVIIRLVTPSKQRLEEVEDQKRIADALEEIAKSKKDND